MRGSGSINPKKTLVLAIWASILVSLFSFSSVIIVSAQGPSHSYRANTLTDSLSNPWGLAFLPDGRMLVTERSGTLRIISTDGTKSAPIDGVPNVIAIGQGGLLDIILHPKFVDNNILYLSYVERGDGGVGTAVARAWFRNDRLEDTQVIFRMKPKSHGGRHFGSRLAFLLDGTLLISLGDRAQRQRAQVLSNHNGTIVRIWPDGASPEDNPFIAKNGGALSQIFSYGHRNVHGLTRHPKTNEIWAHEYGARGGDELNIIKAGANYGWPAITYSVDYSGAVISPHKSAPNMEQPVHYWTPSISPTGMAFYLGDKFPNWHGDLFIGALTPGHLRRLRIRNKKVVSEERLLMEVGSRIRDVRAGPDGFIYVLTDSRNGKLIRIEPR